MRTDIAQPIRLKDYRPPNWLVETLALDFSLHPTETRVRATLKLKPNPDNPAAPLTFDGDGLTLKSLKIDGAEAAADSYAATPDQLTIPQPPNGPFTLEIETLVDPTANTQLSGLYRSSGTWCTQCEAEGFRRITYFPDRPDVMAVYTTRIEADKTQAPVLLSNGNLVESGDLPGGRHFAVWHDPHPKPSYLFALVGGDLACVEDTFRTLSGRDVTLRIYVEHGKEDRCAYAMDLLKRAMRWDEEAFGREYDLDIFMIVAVSDFNMGAMENKGLNVFNDKYVLATPETATDYDYAHIEGVIAHEYFHNWTGNRITCRDWFQLCLKEGLTVFRDQEFSADMRSRPVKRITDVRTLARRAVCRGRGASGASGAARGLQGDQQLLHRDRLREGRGSGAHGEDPDRAGEIPRRHGPLFRAPRRRSRHHRGVHPVLRRRQRPRPGPVHALVFASRHAGSHRQRQLRRRAKTYTLDAKQSLPPTPGQPTKEPMVIPLVLRPCRQGRRRPAARRLRTASGRTRRAGARTSPRRPSSSPTSRRRRCRRSTAASRRRSSSSPTSPPTTSPSCRPRQRSVQPLAGAADHLHAPADRQRRRLARA